MKKILVLFIFLIYIFNSYSYINNICIAEDYNMLPYTGEVLHFFTHELIYDTDRAFSYSNRLRECCERDHLTTSEFRKFLSQMYDKGYVLVKIEDCFSVENGKLVSNILYLPKGKRPFTLSIDDMSYDTYNSGIINKLIVEDDKIKDYTKKDNKIDAGRESITILEDFISEHPDFSINNARICICVNGYNGILGYRTYNNHIPNNKEIEDCKLLVQKLKSLGYTFGCHTFSHQYINNISNQELRKDLNLWNEEVKSIVGNTNVFCFPGGIHKAHSEKERIIKNNGYDLLLCVGKDFKRKDEQNDKIKYIYRIPLDGHSFRTYKNLYENILDIESIYDNNRSLKLK